MTAAQLMARGVGDWFTPEKGRGLKWWLRADTVAGADGDAIGTWSDQSPAGMNATQSTGANKPLLKLNIVNGYPVLRFDGSNDVLATSAPVVAGKQGTFIVACRMTTAQNCGVLSNGNLASNGMAILPQYSGNTKQVVRGTKAIDASATSRDTNWDILVLRVGVGDGVNTYYDFWSRGGSPILSKGGVEALTPGTSTLLGAYIAGSLHFLGDIAEVMAYDSLLDLNDLNGAIRYLADKYAISSVTRVPKLALGTVVCDGDSQISTAIGGSGTFVWEKVKASIGANNSIRNFGSGGLTLANLNSDAATEIDPSYDDIRTSVSIVWAGTNDLFAGATGATTYSRLLTYCAERRAAGWKVIVLTATPRSDTGTAAGYDAERLAFNSSVRTNWATFADALVDIGNTTNYANAGDELNTTYFGDKVHLTNTGRTAVASMIVTALAGLGVT